MAQLDIRGKVCPFATSEVYTALTRLPDGETLEVVSDYAPARATIPPLAQQLGWVADPPREGDGAYTITIRKPTVTGAGTPQ